MIPGWLPEQITPGPVRPDIPDRWRWATVTATSPLRVRLDGETTFLPVTPQSLVDPAYLTTGTRVWVQFDGRRLVVLGAAAGGSAPVPVALPSPVVGPTITTFNITAATGVWQDVPGATTAVTNPDPARGMRVAVEVTGLTRGNSTAILLAARTTGAVTLGSAPNTLFPQLGTYHYRNISGTTDTYVAARASGWLTVPASGTVSVLPQARREGTSGTTQANYVLVRIEPLRFV